MSTPPSLEVLKKRAAEQIRRQAAERGAQRAELQALRYTATVGARHWIATKDQKAALGRILKQIDRQLKQLSLDGQEVRHNG